MPSHKGVGPFPLSSLVCTNSSYRIRQGFFSKIAASGGDSGDDFFETFLKGQCTVDNDANGTPRPVDPLKWWQQQRLAGNENQGWTQMALDIFTCPGKSSLLSSSFGVCTPDSCL